jgi:hypothetical protein
MFNFLYKKSPSKREAFFFFKQRASTLMMILFVFGIVFILSMSMLYIILQDKTLARKSFSSFSYVYWGEFGTNFFKDYLRKIERLPLYKDGKVVEEKLGLLSFDKASNWYKKIILSPYPGIKLTIEGKLLTTFRTPFYCYLSKKSNPPILLNIYKEKNKGDTFSESKELGGWGGLIEITTTVKHGKRQKSFHSIYQMRLDNISSPAPEYTLFIYGTKNENLAQGEFILSNWDFEGTVGKVVIPILKKMADDLKLDFDQMDFNTLVSKIKDFVQSVDSYTLLNKINKIIMNLSPWGKIRTNGRLNVYLPFFEVDDIINYFVDEESLEFPEVGYVGCNNRLHDRFMGKYTRYEGKIYKYYFELRPYIFAHQKKTPRHSLYTMFSTMKNYPLTHKDEYLPKYLKNFSKNIPNYYNRKFPLFAHFSGTHNHPIYLDGIYYAPKDIYIKGYYKGRGIIFAEKGDIHVLDNIEAINKKDDLLILMAPHGKVVLHSNSKIIKIDASICVKNSIIKGRGINLRGNLITENLNREGEDEGIFRIAKMPRIVHITYDARLRNRAAEHIHINITSTPIYIGF